MNGFNNRSESRLRYSWPVWFAENFDDDNVRYVSHF